MTTIELTLNEKKYNASLGLGFFGTFLKDTGLKMNEFDSAVQDNPFYYLPKIVYHSILLYNELEGLEKPEYKTVYNDVLKEGLMSAEMQKFQEALRESMEAEIPKEVGKPKKAAAKK